MYRAVVILCCAVYIFAEYIVKDTHRPLYHISPEDGWLSIPTGFVYHRGKYHVFFQYSIYNRSNKRWGHVESEDLVSWTHQPIALMPDEVYDINGCLSGSALSYYNYILLFYTGIDQHSKLKQNFALSTDGVLFEKHEYNPMVIDIKHSESLLSPKVWYSYEDSKWRMVTGYSSYKNKGKILYFKSNNLTHWSYVNTLTSSHDLGHSWDLPDFFKFQNQYVLIFAANGIQKCNQPYKTGYVIGDFNIFNYTLSVEVSKYTLNFLDYGHDFYGAYTVQAPDGRRLLIAWMGNKEYKLEQNADGWAGIMTIVRELSLSRNMKLLMNPAREMLQLRHKMIGKSLFEPGDMIVPPGNSFELLVNASSLVHKVVLDFYLGNGHFYVVTYLVVQNVVIIDRGGERGLRRASWRPRGNHLFWRVFVDSSSIELFCGDGDVVFSSRIYPSQRINIKVGGDTNIIVTMYALKLTKNFPRQRRHE